MKLSVVIPVYNGADFIEKSYHSILNQNLADFEILYVDNNSKDASIEKINNIVRKDLRVQLLLETKQGAAPARNRGIENAKGDYVYMFDVDDEIYPGALNKMIAVLENYPDVSAVFGKMVKSYKNILETAKPADETDEVILKAKPFWGIHWFTSLRNVVGPPAFLYRASVFTEIGCYNKELRLGQDTAFDIKLGMLRTVAFLDTYVYLYFKHDSSTTEIVKKQTPRAFMVWPRLVKEHLPFYLGHESPIKFKELLFSQLFQSMGRQLVFTKGFVARLRLKRELYNQLKDVSIPFLIRLYLSILVILPLEVLRKVYGYYVVPFAVKQLIK